MAPESNTTWEDPSTHRCLAEPWQVLLALHGQTQGVEVKVLERQSSVDWMHWMI